MRLTTLALAAGLLLVLPAAASAAPPANDDFEQAAPLAVPAALTGTVAEATTQPGEPDHGSQTVWYAFRPQTTQRVAVKVLETPGMDPDLAVYTGSALAALQPVARDPGHPARAAFDAVAGQTYRISVGNVEGDDDGSTFRLWLDPAPLPANDAFADAAPIRIPSETAGDLADATAELGETHHHAHSLWYRFRPRRTGKLTIDFAAVGYDCKVRLYTGSSLASAKLVKEGGSAYADGPTRPMRLTVRRGVRYRLAVNCNEMEQSTFVLTLSDGSIAGKGVSLALKAGQTVASVRANGLRMTVSAKRRVGVAIALRVSRRTMRRLGLESRVLGRTRGILGYDDSKPAAIRLSRRVRRALARTDHLRATVRLELRSDAPNRVLTVPVTL